jgi:hypothetical protein
MGAMKNAALAGKVALVTGAAQGIGRAVAPATASWSTGVSCSVPELSEFTVRGERGRPPVRSPFLPGAGPSPVCPARRWSAR